MPRDDLLEILLAYVDRLREFYGDALAKVYLYGSCARGEATADSDVDVMILLDLDHEAARGRLWELRVMTNAFERERGID